MRPEPTAQPWLGETNSMSLRPLPLAGEEAMQDDAAGPGEVVEVGFGDVDEGDVDEGDEGLEVLVEVLGAPEPHAATSSASAGSATSGPARLPRRFLASLRSV